METRVLNTFGDVEYEVYEGAERKAWGLKDRAVAERWLTRLKAAARSGAEIEFVREADDEAEESESAEAAAVTPRRVWWNE